MNAQQLKNSILQEAIEGRLVPQDPNDEPASVLLERIRKEKAKLVKEGKLKKKDLEEIPISEDEIPFKIPKSWEWVRFSELFNVRSAKRIHQSDWQRNGIPFFRGRELVQLIKTGNVEPEVCITQELYDSLKTYGIPAKDDILISAVGTIGRVYVVRGTKPFYYKDAYILCCENIGKIKPNYVAMALTAPFLQKQIHQDSMATTVAQLTIEKAKGLLIPFPPLTEQKCIVAKIEELLPKIEEYGKAQECLNKLNEELPERLKKSILQEAIEGRLVAQDPNDEPASVLLERIRAEKKRLVKEGKLKKKDLEESPIFEDEIPFMIPKRWEWCRLGNVGEIVTGGTPSKSETKYYGNDYPFYKPADLEQGINTIYSTDSLSVEGYKHSKKLPQDSILVTCIGSIGKTGLIRKEGTCNQQINAIIPFKDYIIPEYLYYFCLSSYFQESMWDSSSSTTLAILNKNKFSQLIIALPPLEEQKRIVEKIEQLFGEIDKLKK